MDANDYRIEAALFFSKTPKSRGKSLVFRRFPRAADAIQYAVEELAPAALDSCSLEVNEQHFFGREIRPLYDSAAYPLRRRSIKARTHNA
ncbi:hypothetical protein V3H18_02165 [Methylocystis sp. 9N]|uniref:Uncharacterized protein n=1 Tax=Methylocystis borbori TaxID=3118750 RepID=A0ABU7XFJ9_9HYPH